VIDHATMSMIKARFVRICFSAFPSLSSLFHPYSGAQQVFLGSPDLQDLLPLLLFRAVFWPF